MVPEKVVRVADPLRAFLMDRTLYRHITFKNSDFATKSFFQRKNSPQNTEYSSEVP
jgi:hypothetical protein